MTTEIFTQRVAKLVESGLLEAEAVEIVARQMAIGS